MNYMNDIKSRLIKLEAILGRGNLNTSTVQQNGATFNGTFALQNNTALPTNALVGQLAVKNGALYICSSSNSWSPVGGIPGYVNSDGTKGTPFPSGWSSAKNSTGSYTVTHNRGATNYAAVATPVSANIAISVIPSSNSFDVECYDNTTGVNVNTDFMFIFSG